MADRIKGITIELDGDTTVSVVQSVSIHEWMAQVKLNDYSKRSRRRKC